MRCRVGIVRVCVGIADIVTFDVINTPLRVKADDRVIVLLRSFCVPADSVHIGIPHADRGRIRDFIRSDIRSEYRHMLMRCFPRDPAHDMDTEFQSEIVYVLRQRRKAFSACRGWKPVQCRKQPAVLVDLLVAERDILISVPHRAGVLCIPLDIHHDVLPACILHVRRHIVRVGFYLLFVDSRVIIVVTVPAHRRLFHTILHRRVLFSCILFITSLMLRSRRYETRFTNQYNILCSLCQYFIWHSLLNS